MIRVGCAIALGAALALSACQTKRKPVYYPATIMTPTCGIVPPTRETVRRAEAQLGRNHYVVLGMYQQLMDGVCVITDDTGRIERR